MKNTPIDYPIHDLIRNRWSPRSFAQEPVSEDLMKSLFEAARWASSSMNEQPWRFIYAHKGEATFDEIAKSLYEGNAWAKEAPVLIVAVVKTTFDRNGLPNGAAFHDLGLAVANLSIQATADDLALHQMGGIDKHYLHTFFHLPDDHEVFTVIALGRRGEPDQLTESLKARELAERKRKAVDQFAFHGTFKIHEYENAAN
jgi:nitroreductase